MSDLMSLYSDYSAGTEPPEQYHWWTFLTTASVYFGRRIRFPVRYRLNPSGGYVCLVAPSGEGRKSSASDLAVDLLELALEGQEEDEALPLIIYEPTRAALLGTLGTATEKFGTTPPALVYNDEARNLFRDPEFVGLLDSLFTRRNYKRETKTQGVDSLKNHSISIITCTTPSWLGEFGPKYGFEEGTLGRFINSYANGRKNRIPWPEESKIHTDLSSKLVDGLRELKGLSGIMQMESNVRRKYDEWYNNYECSDAIAKRTGWGARSHTHLLRTAGSLALLTRQELNVRMDDYDAAFERVMQVEQDLWSVYQKLLVDGEQREIKLIESVIHTAGESGLQHTDLRNKVVRRVGKRQFDDTLAHLTEAQTIFRKKVEHSRGRPAWWYRHNEFGDWES